MTEFDLAELSATTPLEALIEQWQRTNELLDKISKNIDDLERTMRPSARRL